MLSHSAPASGLLVLLASIAGAQTLTIEHQPVSCAVADRFPRLEARFAPAESVAAARVVFQGQSPEWYSVAMKREGAVFAGVLPKPKPSLKEFRYYIEVTGTALDTQRTPDHATAVVASSSCQGGVMAGSVASASVLIQGPVGAVALPAGFAPAGVVAGTASGSTAGAAGASAGGGGGLSGAAVAGIAAGGAAVAGVAVAAGKGSDSTSSSSSSSSTSPPSPTPTPAPTPTPNPPSPTPTPTPSVPCPACYAGTWRLDATFTFIASPQLCGNKASDLGKVITIAPAIFTTDGNIVLPPDGEGRGVVDALGNFKMDFDGDPTGSGLTCPAGGGTGRCTSLTSCSGSGSQGGDTFTLVFTKQ